MTTEAKKVAWKWLHDHRDDMQFAADFSPEESIVALLDSYAAERVAEARLEEHRLTCHKALLQYDVKGKLTGNLRCGEDWECERLIELQAALTAARKG